MPNTKPEILLRKFLHAPGYRRKLNDKELPGKPDIVLPQYRTVILYMAASGMVTTTANTFVVPKTRAEWWLNKINTNMANDAKSLKALKKEGWKIINVWECVLKPARWKKTFTKLLQKLT